MFARYLLQILCAMVNAVVSGDRILEGSTYPLSWYIRWCRRTPIEISSDLHRSSGRRIMLVIDRFWRMSN